MPSGPAVKAPTSTTRMPASGSFASAAACAGFGGSLARMGARSVFGGVTRSAAIAGVYDRKHPERPYSELEFLGEGRGDYPYSELVSAPFPFRLRLSVDGRPVAWERDPVEVYAFHVDLPAGARELVAKFIHTSPLQLTLLVDKAHLRELTARLHREFLGA